MRRVLATILITNVIMLCMSASIVDLISRSEQSRQSSESSSKNCICNGPSCICCLDFNISFVDLGGPGCIRLHYLSPDEGIAINVSYGESLLHNEVVKGPDPAPSCLSIFAKLAQMCARFHGLIPTDDGMRGCVNLEPTLLGEAQLDLPIGCFRMGANGMEVIESPAQVIDEQQPQETDNATTDEGPDSLAGYTAEDILAAVNESAEQGIALITNWLGIAPNATDDTASNANNVDTPPQYAPTVTEHNPYLQQSPNGGGGGGHIVFGS